MLSVDKPLESKVATLLVENRLAAGQHRFALVVIDADGNESAPDVLTVTVRADPDPRLRLHTPDTRTPAARTPVIRTPVDRPGGKP